MRPGLESSVCKVTNGETAESSAGSCWTALMVYGSGCQDSAASSTHGGCRCCFVTEIDRMFFVVSFARPGWWVPDVVLPLHRAIAYIQLAGYLGNIF